MIVEIRLYKSHDTDLVALCSAGYCISNMLKEAIIGYANGTPVHFIVDEFIPFDVSKTKSVRTRFTMPDKEQKACYILNNIKRGYRNSFCKAILRNALIQQNLSCYFTDMNLVQLQSVNLQYKNIYGLTNVIPCSSMKLSEKQIEFLGKKIKRERSRPVNNASVNAYTGVNPFANMGVSTENVPQQQPSSNTQKKNAAPASSFINAMPMPAVQTVPIPSVPVDPINELVLDKPAEIPRVMDAPILGTSPPPPDIKELTSKMAASTSVSQEPLNNKEENHAITATESQDDVAIGVADDDELFNLFESLGG